MARPPPHSGSRVPLDDRRDQRRRGRCHPRESMILSCWRPILLCQKPGTRFKPPFVLQDLMVTKMREKDAHPWQQPEEEAVSLVRALTSPGELVCDLTLGS